MLAAIAELEAASFETRLAIGVHLRQVHAAPVPDSGGVRDH
jgi:hypothetical protein